MSKRLAGLMGMGAVVALTSGFAAPAHASLALTAAGIADGFTLSTFATIDPGNTGFGPFGLGVNNANQVIVSDTVTNNVYVFNDVNGQTPGTALFTNPGAGTGTVGMTATGSFFYGAAPGNGNFGGTFTRYNPNGTVNSSLTGVPYHPYLGMAATPTGHIIATTDSGALIDINPAANGGAGSARVITSGVFGDGVSIDPTGTKAIVEVGGLINVYDIASGALLSSLGTSGAPDGTGAISGGAFNGYIVANTNFGNIDLINPTTDTFTTIATGGTRGDYTAADPNGTLLLTYSDIVARLGIAGGAIGGGGTPTPEPASMTLLGVGLASLGALRRRK